MGEQRARQVRPRWAPVTRTSYVLLPALEPDTYPDDRRLRSQRHLELVASLSDEISRAADGGAVAPWASRSLHACLTHLLTSTVTEAARVWIVDAWTEPDDALCVVYRPPHDEGRVVGLRRCRRDAVEVSDWRIGDLTNWGYDLVGTATPEPVDATRFGWNVADFDLGEPLGYVTTVLRYDIADIGWWGNVGPELPAPPNTQISRESDDSAG